LDWFPNLTKLSGRIKHFKLTHNLDVPSLEDDRTKISSQQYWQLVIAF